MGVQVVIDFASNRNATYSGGGTGAAVGSEIQDGNASRKAAEDAALNKNR